MEYKFYSNADYEKMIELWEAAQLPYKPNGRDSKEKIASSLKNSNLRILLAYINSQLVGSIIVTHDGRKGWINRLAVHPNYWHKGLASKLIQKAEQILQDMNIEIFACLVEDWNKASLQLFQKNGYTKHEDIFYLTKRKHPDI